MKRKTTRVYYDHETVTLEMQRVDAALGAILDGTRKHYAKSGIVQTKWQERGLSYPQISGFKVPVDGRRMSKNGLKAYIEKPLLDLILSIRPDFATGEVHFRLNNREVSGQPFFIENK